MNVRHWVLVAVAAQIISGVVLAMLVDVATWAKIESWVAKYVTPINVSVIAAVSGSTWLDKYVASKAGPIPGGPAGS